MPEGWSCSRKEKALPGCSRMRMRSTSIGSNSNTKRTHWRMPSFRLRPKVVDEFGDYETAKLPWLKKK
jgi:hypothetical protein